MSIFEIPSCPGICRPKAMQLMKKYGGNVVGVLSSKTNYVILGVDSGSKKLEIINENGLFELVRGLPANRFDGKAAEKYAKLQSDKVEIRAMPKLMFMA
ncbi:DNA replication factor C subunit Rfc1 [Penicillium verrucosum]|uniref:DNA replication factor C subunit Rfc1 n=1 Tax=Penicillium verrucosum TaxID=60171 RepID=UPI002544E6D6|nr:DNA replication factor C subunit Rfc1 [Penicillium verrucosum]KAJ5940585.1 DNA replication factor C subunit Rfc1 [Penicillium verrucosum]